jgi:hypothetical protein
MKYRYKCSFNGRLALALGITYKFENIVVTAANEKEALTECYKTHEHISNFKCEKV